MDEDSKGEDIPLTDTETEKNGKNDVAAVGDQFDPKTFLRNPFGETFDGDFWNKVTQVYGDGKTVSWSDALNRIRIKRIKERYVSDNKDPLVALVTEVYDKYEKNATDMQIMASFKQQLHEFARLLLLDEDTERYARLLEIPGQGLKTILHLVAERNLVDIAKGYLLVHPGSVYVTSDKDKLPLELALTARHDDMASFLADKMLNERVRALFESDEAFDARFKMADFIQDPTMQKTVVAILECCVNSDWPFTPVPDDEREEEAWSKMPDTSLRYHFYYRLLDGDQASEPPLINGEENPNFNHRQASCLQLLASSPHSQITMYHPVVRRLVDRKWQNFARRNIRLKCLFYIIFLIIMSCALFTLQDKTTPVTRFRYACEVITILFVLGYVVNEVDEMEKERLKYWKDFYNYADLLGLVLILLLIPLRATGPEKAERIVGAIAYLINCGRVFKYFPAFKEIGIYSKTFANIIYKDITMFALVYGICFMAFSGAIFLSVLATEGGTTLTLKGIFLKEFRALAEGNPFNDDYDSFNGGITFLIMINMLVVIVILSNILIGQLSYRYELARAEAGMQYSIDKTKFITRMENNRFKFLNNRIKFYMDGDYVSEQDRVKVLLQDWADKKAESVEFA